MAQLWRLCGYSLLTFSYLTSISNRCFLLLYTLAISCVLNWLSGEKCKAIENIIWNSHPEQRFFQQNISFVCINKRMVIFSFLFLSYFFFYFKPGSWTLTWLNHTFYLSFAWRIYNLFNSNFPHGNA